MTLPDFEALRDRPEPKAIDADEPRPADDEGGRAILACASCRRPITSDAARIDVGGAHAHTFVNPEGIEFRIGCFGLVTGCLSVGDPTTYWSWFPGYAWRIEVCATCRAHLGWEFRSSDHSFHGLILVRLIPLEERA